MDNPIKKIVVVGRDADAWLTALMLQLSFANSENKKEVQLIELPSKVRPQDYYAVLPSHKALHKMFGINEKSLLRSASGLYVLAQRFSNWTPSISFMHPYDTHGTNFNHVDFIQYWLKARMNGFDVPLDAFSMGAVAARQGRFAALDQSLESFSQATYGYHLSALPYLKGVGRAALKAGLVHCVGEIKSVAINEGHIQAVTLQDDTVIDGDLFIDASGVDALLISQLENNNYESWQHWFPCDRALVVSAPPMNPAPAFSQISAFSEGWLGFFSLLDRTAVTAVYSSKYTTSEAVLQKIKSLLGIKIGDAIESTLASGARKKPWIGNCIAIGSAAANLDLLDATHLHMLDLGLSLLRVLFPVDKDNMPEAAVFNEKIYSHAVNVRDFQIAHYQLNKRYGDPLWDGARDSEPPVTLTEKIRLFSYRGRISLREDEAFQEESWISIFVGHGVLPQSYDPLVDNMPESEQIENFQRILNYIAYEVEKMPSLQAHVEMSALTSQ